jgi:hypothetical protein
MPWATRTTTNPCYVLHADSEEHPVSSYRPNEILMIHIRVKCIQMQYRGLLIYAVDEYGKRVGDWNITAENPTTFKRPWEDPLHKCFGSLMHANAELKPYHSILYYSTPPVGTGTINFQVLIKVCTSKYFFLIL